MLELNKQIHTGPLGRNAFPSVYRTSAPPWSYLPHSGRWMLSAMLVSAAGAAAWAMGVTGGAPALGVGVLGLLVTVLRCIGHSLRSEIDQLPPMANAGELVSRTSYRALIAYLHFIQPLARVHGRIRGWYHAPTDRPEQAPRPSRWTPLAARHSVRAWRWLVGQPIDLQFWSERWIDPHDFCRLLVRHLRSQRFVRSIGVDDGWWEDHDLNIEVGWALRVTARILVEDHGAAGSLCRVGIRARLRGRCGAAAGAAIAILALSGTPATGLAVALTAGSMAVGVALAMARAWTSFQQAHTAAVTELLASSQPRAPLPLPVAAPSVRRRHEDVRFISAPVPRPHRVPARVEAPRPGAQGFFSRLRAGRARLW